MAKKSKAARQRIKRSQRRSRATLRKTIAAETNRSVLEAKARAGVEAGMGPITGPTKPSVSNPTPIPPAVERLGPEAAIGPKSPAQQAVGQKKILSAAMSKRLTDSFNKVKGSKGFKLGLGITIGLVALRHINTFFRGYGEGGSDYVMPPGLGRGYKEIPGLLEAGMSSSLRYHNTDFGSSYDYWKGRLLTTDGTKMPLSSVSFEDMNPTSQNIARGPVNDTINRARTRNIITGAQNRATTNNMTKIIVGRRHNIDAVGVSLPDRITRHKPKMDKAISIFKKRGLGGKVKLGILGIAAVAFVTNIMGTKITLNREIPDIGTRSWQHPTINSHYNKNNHTKSGNQKYDHLYGG